MGKGAEAEWALKPTNVIPRGKPFLVCVLDGWGENKIKDEYNAVSSTPTPCYDALSAVQGQFRTVKAHGPAVGLPTWDDMGNSEVGHNALGSGQLIDQGARLVDRAIETEAMFEGDGFKHIAQAFDANTLHVITLLSDGGVHSRLNQSQALMLGAAKRGAKKIRLHVLLDGRDVPDGTSINFLEEANKTMEELKAMGCDACIASGGGRMHITMDRYEAEWEMVKRGYETHILGKAPNTFTDAVEGVKTLRSQQDPKPDDQYVPAFVIVDGEGAPVGKVVDGDAVVLANFRADRMCEMSKALEYEDFSSFEREEWPKMHFAGLMQYDGDLGLPKKTLVDAPSIQRTCSEFLAKNGLRTFACSETQKFGHVTFFWNGNRSGYFDEKLETYVEIPSDVGITFDVAPNMKAEEICAAGVEALKSGKFDHVRINFANPDMVGHTGNLEATKQAVALCDAKVQELVDTVNELGGIYLITADHGNADDMVQRNKKTKEPAKNPETGENLALTSHTLAPVPVLIGGSGLPEGIKFKEGLEDAGLANVTGTIMNLMGYETPEGWEESLI